ncbi:hypothetical protein JTB14_020926 [Gonioctena quinquepunctata]|nr:hypothetical protein JTB14_020926 [Gonioctena quinquepunctata]
MRYRGIKLQDFFNLSQQVHLYNMNPVHSLEQIKEEIDSSHIDQKATTISWLGGVQCSALKVHFFLEDIPFYDTSNMCDLLTNLGSFNEKEESWDTPFRWRDSKSLTKEDDSEDEVDSKDGLAEINYSRDPEEEMAQLSSPVESEEGIKETKDIFNETMRENMTPVKSGTAKYNTDNAIKKNIVSGGKNVFETEKPEIQKIQLRKIDDTNRNKIDRENFTINSSPANKDFDYIKATPVNTKPKYTVDPIAELRSIARKDSNTSEDDPPFNFQGMLRKTNFKRESLKNKVDAVRRFSLTGGKEKEIGSKAVNGSTEEEPLVSRPVSMEIFPGLIIEGVEVEL